MSKKWEIETPSEFICTDDYYLINGKKYYRVTRIISIIDKPELRRWYGRMGNAKAKNTLKTRSDDGSTTHKLIEIILSGKPVDLSNYNEGVQSSVSKFIEFQKKNKLIPEACEQHLWSEQNCYAGTADFIGYCNGKHVLMDWKTSKGIYDEYWLQMSAYVMAFEEQTGIKLEGASILRVRDGEIEKQHKTYEELKNIYNVFLSAIEIFRWKYKND